MTRELVLLILRRLGYMLVIILAAMTVIFLMLRIAPGDPSYILLGSNFGGGTMEQRVAEIRAFYGLDKPIIVQYLLYFQSVFTADFGRSILSGQEVVQIVASKIGNTILLATAAALLTYTTAIPLGVLAALRRNSWVDHLILGISVIGLAIPNFALAIILVWGLSVQAKLLPLSGTGSIQHLILPTIVLAMEAIAVTLRLVRSSMLDQLSQDYVRTLSANGLRRRRIVWVHVLRNALVPVVAFSAVQLRTFLGYTLIVEIVFRWPGIGSALVDSILKRDYILAQALALILVVAVIIINQLTDLAHRLLDPRLRTAAETAR